MPLAMDTAQPCPSLLTFSKKSIWGVTVAPLSEVKLEQRNMQLIWDSDSEFSIQKFCWIPFLKPQSLQTKTPPPQFTSFQYNWTCSNYASPYSCYGIVKPERLGRQVTTTLKQWAYSPVVATKPKTSIRRHENFPLCQPFKYQPLKHQQALCSNIDAYLCFSSSLLGFEKVGT